MVAPCWSKIEYFILYQVTVYRIEAAERLISMISLGLCAAQWLQIAAFAASR